MKNIVFGFVLITIALVSCSNENNKSNDNNAKSKDTGIAREYQSCNEFLDEYESWAEKYIGTLKIFKTDPSNPKLAKRYSYQTRELITWQQEWDELIDCVTDENYLKRYKTITEKIEKQQKKLEGK